MSDTTKISWTDKTWSPWQGCTKVSPGCDHCYAENIADTRFHIVEWGPGKPRKHTENWDSPRRWNKTPFLECEDCGHRDFDTKFGYKKGQIASQQLACPMCGSLEHKLVKARVFPSMCDPFDNEVPTEWRTRFFNLIRETPNLTWLILTKRIGNAGKMLRESGAITRNGIIETPLPNLWLGATCVNQEEADRDIPKLLNTIAAKRFVSIEPMLGAVDLTHIRHVINERGHVCWTNSIEAKEANDAHAMLVASLGPDYPYTRLDWVIAGGESGHGARPAHPDWFRSLRDQCEAAGVPFHFKQWGEWYPVHADPVFGLVCCAGNQTPNGPATMIPRKLATTHITEHNQTYARWGTQKSGRHLDGREHLEFPQC